MGSALVSFLLPAFALAGSVPFPDFANTDVASERNIPGISDHGPVGRAGEVDPPLAQLLTYYPEVFNGLIATVAGAPEGTELQDLFALDQEAFMRQEHASNFLDAKRSFYSRLDYLSKEQRHERPYYYLSSWYSLFHPPIKTLSMNLEKYHPQMAEAPSHAEQYFQPEFQRSIDSLSGSELTAGNELKLLPNNASFEQKLRLVRESQRYFFGIVMVYFCDESTLKLLDEMAGARNRGVDVRLMVEGLYASTLTNACTRKIKKAGIDVVKISDFFKLKTFSAVMHNKFWIRDGEEAVFGGMNMHAWENESTGFNNKTRDTDMLIKGPLVTELLGHYVKLWEKHRSGKNQKINAQKLEWRARMDAEVRFGLRGAYRYEQWLGSPETRMKGLCRMLVQRAGATEQPIAPTLQAFVTAAKKSVWFTTPSVRFDLKGKKHDANDELVRAIKQKAEYDGVKFEVVSNGIEGGVGDGANFIRKYAEVFEKADIRWVTRLVEDLNLSLARNGAEKDRKTLMDLSHVPNIRAWSYFNFLHAKTWLFDRTVSVVGSYNLDGHSSKKNHEAAAFCMDADLGGQLERQMVMDMVNSVPVVSRNGL